MRQLLAAAILLIAALLLMSVTQAGAETVTEKGKYLLLWELDRTRVPISPQERASGWSAIIGMVKQDLEKGTMKDWGAFVGELRGYAVAEGTQLEIAIMIQQYVPFVFFKVHPISSMSQVNEVIKALSK